MDEEFLNRRIHVLNEKEQEILKNYGFIIHFTTSTCGNYLNYHTHGLKKNFNHKDLQIVINYYPGQVEDFFKYFISIIKDGQTLEPRVYDNLFSHLVRLNVFEEQNREVLRVIFADQNNLFPEDEDCHPLYREQMAVFDTK